MREVSNAVDFEATDFKLRNLKSTIERVGICIHPCFLSERSRAMVLSEKRKLMLAMVAIGGLAIGCGRLSGGGLAGRMTTEEYVAAVELLTSDIACRDSRIREQWWLGATTQELVDAVLGYPANKASLRPGESLRTFVTANGTVSIRCLDVDGLPPDLPESLCLEIANQIVTRPQAKVDVENLKKRILAIKQRIDPVDTAALATEIQERWQEEEDERIAKEEQMRKLADEQARREQADREREQAAQQAEYRRKDEERAREFAELQEQGRDRSQADRDYLALREKIQDRDLANKFSTQYVNWYERRAAHLGEQRRQGKDRRSVPLPSLAAIEKAIKSGTDPVPVGD